MGHDRRRHAGAYHPGVYDRVLSGYVLAQRRRIEGTLGGLRFVRNQLRGDSGCGDLVHPANGPGAEEDAVTAWTWRTIPEPPLGPLPPRGRAWELTRYQAYQAHLAGRSIGEVFGLTTEFLDRATDAVAVWSAGQRHA